MATGNEGTQSFVDTMFEINKGPGEKKDFPKFPPPDEELVDTSKEELQKKVTNQLLEQRMFRCHYRVFDITEEDQTRELQGVMDHILRDGWVLATEEQQIMRDGRVLVVVKYLIPDVPPPKPANSADS